MRLTRTTSHAIRILIACADAEGKLVKTAEIAKRLDITPLNVFKIVNMLSHAGFVEPVRGRNGGVRLARAAEAIKIGEVVRVIEDPDVEVTGAVGKKTPAKPGLNSIFDDAPEAFIGVLDQHSIADMGRGRGPLGDGSEVAKRPRSTKAAAKTSPTLRG